MRALRQRIAEFGVEQDAAKPEAETPRKSRFDARRASVITHRAFVPMLGVWGVALGASSVLTLPASIIARLAVVSELNGFGESAGYLIAAIAAVLVGGLAAVAGLALQRARSGSHYSGSITTLAARRVQPIDPAAELGSESLDAPIEVEPFTASAPDLAEDQLCEAAEDNLRGPTLGELATRNYEDEPAEPIEAEACEAGSGLRFTRKDFQAALVETCEGAAEEVSDLSQPPRELDLAEFGELPGRNAVWVDEPTEDLVAEPAQEPQAEQSDSPIGQRAQSAIEKLRQTPPRELSLMQMVERFAAALHEHQAAEHKRPDAAHTHPNRDVALAEALKALTALTDGEFVDGRDLASDHGDGKSKALRDTTRELRDALGKLQNLRGAA